MDGHAPGRASTVTAEGLLRCVTVRRDEGRNRIMAGRHIRFVFALLACMILALGGSISAAAQAEGNAANAESCRNGGYRYYTDANGDPFRNVGQCVSHAARGNALVALDSDADGLSDRDEIAIHGTDPFASDTDGDGIGDGIEVAGGSDPLTVGTATLVRVEFKRVLDNGQCDVTVVVLVDGYPKVMQNALGQTFYYPGNGTVSIFAGRGWPGASYSMPVYGAVLVGSTYYVTSQPLATFEGSVTSC
jgi:hypothetical protein